MKGSARAGNPDRLKALDNTVGQIERQFGKGAIMRLGEERPPDDVSTIPTGALSLDLALGIGGIPRGRIIEVFGPESSGKTTLVLHMMANAQKQGGTAAFIDAEHALDAKYAQALGVDIDDLLVSQPDTGEQALEITDMLVRSNAVDIIAIDSVAALVPRAEIEGEMGDANVGLQARLMSQAMRKLTGSVSKSRTCIVFINQIRMKIGVMFGNPETTTGGNALKFYATLRLDIRRIGALKEGTTAIGNRTRVKVVKNKLAPPFREAEFDIIYGKGISFEGDLVDLAAEKGIVEKSGSWFSYAGERIGQGREAARTLLEENAELRSKLERAVRQAYGLTGDAGSAQEKGPVGEKGLAAARVSAAEKGPGSEKATLGNGPDVKAASDRTAPEKTTTGRPAPERASGPGAEKNLAAAEKGK